MILVENIIKAVRKHTEFLMAQFIKYLIHDSIQINMGSYSDAKRNKFYLLKISISISN